MEIIPLTSDYEMKPFDCGDTELNGFLLHDAKAFDEKRLAKTFLFCEEDVIVGYFSLLNDKIAKQDVSKAVWRKIKKLFPHSKHFGSYPAVKIGRFAISERLCGKGLGRILLNELKYRLRQECGYSTFRFLTVDAYQGVVPFYERNGFKRLTLTEEGDTTCGMYFDMKTLDV